MVLGQGCGETLQGLQGSWVACVRNHGNRVGWGEPERKKEATVLDWGWGWGAGDRVNSRAAPGARAGLQCTGLQTFWVLSLRPGHPSCPAPPPPTELPPTSHNSAPSSISCLPHPWPPHILPFHHLNVLTRTSCASDAVTVIDWKQKYSSHQPTPY